MTYRADPWGAPNGKPKDEPACNGRGTKTEHRYHIQHRLQSDSWTDIPHTFASRRDACDYASMCSCYPVIYGMTRVIDNLDRSVVATFSAGEGLKQPLHKPGVPPYFLQLRYTVSAAGETWGWLTKSFHSMKEALAFARRELFPRNICDAVRVVKEDHALVTWTATDECTKPCTRDTNGDGNCHRCAPVRFTIKGGPRSKVFEQFVEKYQPRNDAADAMAYSAAQTDQRDRLLGFPVVQKDLGIKPGGFKFGPIPNYQELGGRTLDVPRVREWFSQWFRQRFNTEYNPEIDLHCAMFEAFRGAMGLRVLRQHQS